MDNVKARHALSVLGTFSEMKRRRFICDFWIRVGDEECDIPTHRTVLAASSDFFVQLFSAEKKEPLNEVDLKRMNSAAVKTSIDFMYNGVAHVDMQNVREVLQVATKLKIAGLVNVCIQYLEDSISLRTCFEIRAVATEYHFPKLQSEAERYAHQNFDIVIKLPEFHNLTSTEVKKFIASSNHIQKWEAAITWVGGCVEERLCCLFDMLGMILSDRCPFDFVYEKMLFHSLVEKSNQCSILVAEGLFRAIAPFNVNLANCFDLLQVAKTFEEQCPKEVLQALHDFVAANYDSVGNTDGFRSLGGNDLLEVLSSDNAMIHTAIDRWKPAILWVKGDLQRRKSFLREILGRIDWKQCALEDFLKQVFGDCLVRKFEESAHTAASILFSIMDSSDVTKSNWFYLLHIAKTYKTPSSGKAVEKVLTFVSANFSEISRLQNFGKLCEEDLIFLCRNEYVRSKSDKIQWDGILRWVNRDVESRKEDLFDVLENTNLKSWKFHFVHECVFRSKIVQDSDVCCKLVVSSLLSNLEEDDLGVRDCFELLQIAKDSESEFSNQAVGRIRKFLGKNFGKVSQSPEFVQLDATDLHSILDMEEFKLCNEELKWTPIFDWVTHDKSRHEHLTAIIRKLGLENFSFRFLDTRIYPQDLIHSFAACKDLCISAMLSNMKYADISIVNWYGLLQLVKESEHPKDVEVKAKIAQFMAVKFSVIQKQARFGSLEKKEILQMLSSPEIVNTPPEDQLQGAFAWLNGGPDREGDAAELLRSMKLEGFPFDLLFTNLTSDPRILKWPELTEIFLKALQCSLKIDNITTENWYTLLKKTEMTAYKKLHLTILKFVARNFEVISQQTQFNELEIDDLWAVLRSSDLRVREVLKVRAIISWIKADEGRRDHDLPDLLLLVQLKHVPNDYLRQMHSDRVVNNSSKCKDMMLEALFAKDRQVK